MKTFTVVLTLAISAALASPAAAQDNQPRRQEVPDKYQPPPGMCRIWIDDVPPDKQPASTDCPTAVKNRPSNARVLFGDDYAKSGKRKMPSLVKSFTDDKSKRPDSAKPLIIPRKPNE